MYHALITAGGVGERFWPLSRSDRPKQLLRLLDDRTMIRLTVDRLLPLVPPERLWVITSATLGDAIAGELPELAHHHILREPFPRNTAVAIALAARRIAREDPNASMLVQAADHAIGGNEDFRRLLTVAEAHARASGNLVTIGFPPTRVGPGFGHIELGGPLETRDGLTFFRVARFIEKPPVPDAERFTQSGHHLWNSGIFVWTLQDLEQAYRRHMPDLWEALDGLVEVGEPTAERLEPLYSCLKPVAFEHGVLEKSSNLAVVPGIFTWEDIGSWDGLRTVLPGDENGNVIKGQVLTYDVDNSILVAEEGLLGVIGLKDMVVVKSGDCVLVCPRARAQEVRDLLSLHRHAPELLGRR